MFFGLARREAGASNIHEGPSVRVGTADQLKPVSKTSDDHLF
jgi:hypothetical protein